MYIYIYTYKRAARARSTRPRCLSLRCYCLVFANLHGLFVLLALAACCFLYSWLLSAVQTANRHTDLELPQTRTRRGAQWRVVLLTRLAWIKTVCSRKMKFEKAPQGYRTRELAKYCGLWFQSWNKSAQHFASSLGCSFQRWNQRTQHVASSLVFHRWRATDAKCTSARAPAARRERQGT